MPFNPLTSPTYEALDRTFPLERYQYFAPQLHFFYCKTPKNASSKISRLITDFALSGFGECPDKDLRPVVEALRTHGHNAHSVRDRFFLPPLAYPQEYVKGLISAGQLFSFCFTRNPFTRLVSGYANLILATRPDVHKSAFRNAILASLAYDGKAPSFGYFNYDPPSFKGFVSYVCACPDAELDDHFAAQHHQNRSLYYPYDFIGKVETFEQDMGFVLERLQELNAMTFPRWVFEQLGTKTNSARWKMTQEHADYYTEELREMVYKRFRTDFELYGYSPSLEHAKL